MSYVDSLLERSAPAMVYPPTPALRVRVLGALGDVPSAGTSGVGRGGWAAAGAVACAVVAALALAMPGPRGAVADFFGIEGSEIEVLPTPAPGVTRHRWRVPRASRRTPRRSRWRLRRQARDSRRYCPKDRANRSPCGSSSTAVPIVILEYDDFVLWEADLDDGSEFGKLAPAGVTITDLAVNEAPARWISGGGHIVQFFEDGTPVAASVRTVDRNTLIWATDAALYRLETDKSLDEALAIAETLP